METKNRATRRAHGQRNTSPRVHSARLRLALRAETGPQRAQRRAAARGLAVGRSVAAQCHGWLGLGDPPSSRHYVPREERTYAGPGGATPLARVDRLARYLLQRDVTTHVRHGVNWQPTPRQRRRLDKKERAAAVRTYLDGKATEARYAAENPAGYAAAMAGTRGPAASAVTVDELVTSLETGEQRAEPLAAPVTPEQFTRGFRVVDRRGEHRS